MLQEDVEASRAAPRASQASQAQPAGPGTDALSRQHDSGAHAHPPGHPEGRPCATSHSPHQSLQGNPGDPLSPIGSHPPGRSSHPSALGGQEGDFRSLAHQQASLHRPVAMRLAPSDLMAQLSQQLPVPHAAEQGMLHAQPESSPGQAAPPAQPESSPGQALRHERRPEQATGHAQAERKPAQKQQQQLQHEVTLRAWDPQAAGHEAADKRRDAQAGAEQKPASTAPGLRGSGHLQLDLCA